MIVRKPASTLGAPSRVVGLLASDMAVVRSEANGENRMEDNGNLSLTSVIDQKAGSVASEGERNFIVLACDERYAVPLATSIRSIVEANRTGLPVEILVLTSEFSAEKKKKVSNSVPLGSASLRWVKLDLSRFAEFYTRNHISKTSYARLLLSYVLPIGVSRVLYLDADVLVLDDLQPLWHLDLGGTVLGAVTDIDSEDNAKRLRLDGKPGGHDYFNAGVLLVDVKRWKDEHISEKALKYLEKNPHTFNADQDALNVVCSGRWKQLDTRWNHQIFDKAVRPGCFSSLAPSILHFIGPFKPWDPRSISVNAGLYNSVRKRTCFARTTFEVAGDRFIEAWYRSKRYLRQYKLMRTIWRIAIRRESQRALNSPAQNHSGIEKV
jgi:lipopolysaccharide biosynthesis glycosyltransferase